MLRRAFLVLCFSLTLIPHSAQGQASTCAPDATQVFSLPYPTLESIRAANHVSGATIIRKGIKDFCIETAGNGLPEYFSQWPSKDHHYGEHGPVGIKQFKTIEEINEVVSHSPDQIFIHNEWLATQFPNSKIRRLAYDDKLSRSVFFIRNPGSTEGPPTSTKLSEEEIRKYLSDPKQNGSRFSEIVDSYKVDSENIADLLARKDDKYDKTLKNVDNLKSYVLCSTYSLKNASDCAKALQGIIKKMAPKANKFGNFLTAIPTLSKVISDESYQQGAGFAAIKIMDRVKNNDLNGDLFNDIKTSYQMVGLTETDAQEHAWNLITVWASRGPNISPLSVFLNERNHKTLAALDIISSAAPYLDQLRIENGKNPYSYPPNVKSTCSYGKAYHFWMTAALARQFGKELKAPEAAMYASYLAELGYQMKSQTDGRDINRVFMVNAFDPANNKLRIDVAYGAAGATYGMYAAKGNAMPVISINAALTNMIKKSKVTDPLNKNDSEQMWSGTGVTGYFRWKDIIAPDAALDLYNP